MGKKNKFDEFMDKTIISFGHDIKNQKLADLNLVKEEDDGAFTVISIPRLEYLRRKRLMGN